nr:MAG TPA: hypothetical protein [Caudoviricetes sp.]
MGRHWAAFLIKYLRKVIHSLSPALGYEQVSKPPVRLSGRGFCFAF